MKRVPKRPRTKAKIVVRALSPAATRGLLSFGSLSVPCALGRSGRRVRKREGDGATPVGSWPIRRMFYRADRACRPRTRLPVAPIDASAGWCDAPGDRNYNRPVRHPYAASAEHMWRADNLYDAVVVLGYNDRPRARGLGSAIFMHLARPGYAPTEGCIALERRHLLRVIERARRGTVVRVC